ncbi:MAG: hypothetical protein WC462_03055 [archaeon]
MDYKLNKVQNVEIQFNLANLKKSEKYFIKLMKKGKFSELISLLEEISDIQIRLSGIFMNLLDTKYVMGGAFVKNVVLNNALLNQPYINNSVFLLLRHGYYGSARVILRQNFEMLVVAKASEENKKYKKKWLNKRKTSDLTYNITLGDVFSQMGDNRKQTQNLEAHWKDLCDMSHATAFAQQMLIIPDLEGLRGGSRKKEFYHWVNSSKFIPEMAMTLDFAFLNFLFFRHLVNLQHKKARGWYMGYVNDPFYSEDRIKELKNRYDFLCKEYLVKIDKLHHNNKTIQKSIKKKVKEFRQSWEIK